MLNFEYHAAVPGIRAALENVEGILWWGRRDNVITIPAVIDGSTRYNNGSTNLDVLPPGLLLGKIRSTGKLKQWDPTATDGTEQIYGALASDQKMQAQGADLDRWRGMIIVAGPMKPTGFYISGTAAAGINAHAYELLIRAQMNRAIFDDEPQGNAFGGWRHVIDKTASFTAVEADNNILFTNLGATATVRVTLPAPRYGYRIGVFVAAGNSVQIVAASGTPIICEGDATRDEVVIAPNIGTMVEIIGKDATNYLAKITHPASGGGAGGRLAGNRYQLTWTAGEYGKPSLNADILNASEAVRMLADRQFEVLGGNMTSALVTYDVEGGIKFTTAGTADGDAGILLPHLDTTQSAWASVTWGTDQEVEWECRVQTDSAITTALFYCGLKLTNTDVIATDDDQVFFRYEVGVNSGKIQTIFSIGDSDTAADSGITVAINTEYHFRISIGPDRIARMYINGELITTTTALTDATDLIPYIGVATSGATTARALTIRGQDISRNAA